MFRRRISHVWLVDSWAGAFAHSLERTCEYETHASIATEAQPAIDTLDSLIEDAINGDRTDSLPAGLRDLRVVQWTARCAAVAVPEPDKSFPFIHPEKNMIENEITTSEYLLELLHPMVRDPRVEGLPNEREFEELLDEMTRRLFDGLESFHQPDYGSARALFDEHPPQFIMQQMDYQFSRDLLTQIPKYVERFLELDELWGTSQPSRRVASLLREATRCYVFGFWQASIALSRAAIEEALRERVAELTNEPTHKLGQLIGMAQRVGLLDHDHTMMANAVKRFGDEVLHGTETWSGNAKEAVISARGVLEHLHR